MAANIDFDNVRVVAFSKLPQVLLDNVDSSARQRIKYNEKFILTHIVFFPPSKASYILGLHFVMSKTIYDLELHFHRKYHSFVGSYVYLVSMQSEENGVPHEPYPLPSVLHSNYSKEVIAYIFNYILFFVG